MNRRIATLTVRRNKIAVLQEIHSRMGTICCDSMFGSGPMSAMLIGFTYSDARQSKVHVTLTWDFAMPAQSAYESFKIHGDSSHKYWLRNLIRRCR